MILVSRSIGANSRLKTLTYSRKRALLTFAPAPAAPHSAFSRDSLAKEENKGSKYKSPWYYCCAKRYSTR